HRVDLEAHRFRLGRIAVVGLEFEAEWNPDPATDEEFCVIRRMCLLIVWISPTFPLILVEEPVTIWILLCYRGIKEREIVIQEPRTWDWLTGDAVLMQVDAGRLLNLPRRLIDHVPIGNE